MKTAVIILTLLCRPDCIVIFYVERYKRLHVNAM